MLKAVNFGGWDSLWFEMLPWPFISSQGTAPVPRRGIASRRIALPVTKRYCCFHGSVRLSAVPDLSRGQVPGRHYVFSAG